jgi:hypothetical protein
MSCTRQTPSAPSRTAIESRGLRSLAKSVIQVGPSSIRRTTSKYVIAGEGSTAAILAFDWPISRGRGCFTSVRLALFSEALPSSSDSAGRLAAYLSSVDTRQADLSQYQGDTVANPRPRTVQSVPVASGDWVYWDVMDLVDSWSKSRSSDADRITFEIRPPRYTHRQTATSLTWFFASGQHHPMKAPRVIAIPC